MQSPKSKKRPWQGNKIKPKYQKRKHLNAAFYNSSAWRKTRKAFMKYYQEKLWMDVSKERWGALVITKTKQSHILSLTYVPCNRCLNLFILGAYNEISEGKEVDHIDPLNPIDAIQSEGYGDPFDFDNLQPLCPRHHAKKSNRDKQVLKLKK